MAVRWSPRRVTEEDLRAIDAILDECAGAKLPKVALARLKVIVEKGVGKGPVRGGDASTTD